MEKEELETLRDLLSRVESRIQEAVAEERISHISDLCRERLNVLRRINQNMVRLQK